jgi:CO/xanthine dehydrogenase FAD-binding subunit
MGLPTFEYYCPETLPDLERLLNEHKDHAKILAGGTDLLVRMKGGIQRPAVLVDIGNLASLQGIFHEEGKGTKILAGTKIATIESSPLIQEKIPGLYQAVQLLGSPQVRAMATLGGNICNASPSAETLPILMALGSELTVAGNGSGRSLPIESFFLDYRRVDLRPEEYLKSVFIPEQSGVAGSAYLCRMLRRAMEIDLVNVGVWFLMDPGGKCQEARIALGSVAPIPFRARKAEAALVGQPLSEERFQQAGELASEESSPIDDIRGPEEYRRAMVRVLVARTLSMALKSLVRHN